MYIYIYINTYIYKHVVQNPVCVKDGCFATNNKEILEVFHDASSYLLKFHYI